MVLRRGTPALDVNIFPMQRDEYLAIPAKTQQGMPSRYYFDRGITTASSPVVAGATGPTITLWSAPENSTDIMIYYRMRRLQDAGIATNTADAPYRFQEALCCGLSARLAVKFAPDREGALAAKYQLMMSQAKQEDRQRSPTTFRMAYSGRGR